MFLICSLAVATCTNNYDVKDDGTINLPNKFSWQGHRGARGLSPENTIPSFLKALEYPVTTLELDVAVSKDKQLIVSHEPWFNGDICNMPDGSSMDDEMGKKRNIYQMTYEEIKTYDCGSRGNDKFPHQIGGKTHKPSFKDMVKAIESYCSTNNKILPNYNIEIKSEPEEYGVYTPYPADFVALVLKEIKELGIEHRCNLQSFDIAIMEEIHEQAPEIPIAFLVMNESGVASNLEQLSFQPTIYSPYYKMLSEAAIKECHTKGIKVIPWTVNNGDSARELISWGVDGIITDYPNMAK